MENLSKRLKDWKFIPLLLQAVQFGIYFFTFIQTRDVWKEDKGYCIALGYLFFGVCLLQLLGMWHEKKHERGGEDVCLKSRSSVTEEEFRRLFAVHFGLTSRETEAFERLITSEDGVQEIADGLYMSRRSLQRHIAAIYDKTGTKSRIGLFQCYIRFRSESGDIEE